MNFKDFEQEVYKNALDKGWWENPCPPAQEFALFHSELSESLDAYRKFENDRIGEELADFVIRMVGFIPAFENGKIKPEPFDDSFPCRIQRLHSMVNYALYNVRSIAAVRVLFHEIIDEAFDLAKSQGFDLGKEIRMKHERNKARPYRHGGRKC